MIPRELLSATEGRAVGICPYGATGMWKTHAIRTCPPPILHLDIGEGGTGSLIPWIYRRKNSDDAAWTVVSPEERQRGIDLLDDDTRRKLAESGRGKPNPLIDTIHFDNLEFDSFLQLTEVINGFDINFYNTLAIDSLQELSVETQTYSRGKGNEMKTMNEIPFSWVRAQERAMIFLRKIRGYRKDGVVVYMTGSEDISKDYVNNPMEKKDAGAQREEPYSIRGTVNLPGKLAEGLMHLPDVVCHARLMGGSVVWVTEPEPLGGGTAWWDAKDRYGRLPKYVNPDVRQMFEKLYGKEASDAIYNASKQRLATALGG